MLQLVRIDDRLVHGQVVVGWGKSLQFNRIIVCDPDLGAEDWEQQLIKSACPPDVEILFFDEESLLDEIDIYINDKVKTIILIGKIDVLNNLINQNFPLNEINLGGIHYQSGRDQVLSYLYLSREEKLKLKSILSRGYHLFAQDLPTSKKYELKNMI